MGMRCGQEFHAFFLDQLYHRPRRGKEAYLVSMEIAERSGKLDRVRLGSTYLELMSKDENFHAATREVRIREVVFMDSGL